jgi:hypothetical protein
MKYKPLLFIAAAVLVSIAVVGMLYIRSDKKVNHRYASFDRKFPTAHVHAQDSFKLKYDGYYFAGNASGFIFLGHKRAPNQLLAVNKSLSTLSELTLQVDQDSLAYRAIRVTVDSPYYFLADGTQPFIYRGMLPGGKATAWITDTRFTKAIPLSGISAALVSIRNYENTLVKKVKGETEPKLYPDILEEQGEGIFSTDGMFLYDKETARLVYVYFYRNQYISFDTAFHSVTRGNTLDTVSVAKIKTARISSQKSRTMKAPPLMVNKLSAVYGNLLYINSNLLAKNESVEEFEKASVIDVYDMNTQTYRHSFYLPAYKGKKASEFYVTDNYLYALYGTHLLRYHVGIHNDIAVQ